MVRQLNEVRLVSVDIHPGPNAFGEFITVMKTLEQVAVETSNKIALFGSAFWENPGRRRHGLIKHGRDLRRQRLKAEARR